MYREVRETTAARAMNKMYQEMAGQYHIRYQDIQVVSFTPIKNVDDIRRTKTLVMIPSEKNEVKFPHPFPGATVKREAKHHRFAKKIPEIFEWCTNFKYVKQNHIKRNFSHAAELGIDAFDSLC